MNAPASHLSGWRRLARWSWNWRRKFSAPGGCAKRRGFSLLFPRPSGAWLLTTRKFYIWSRLGLLGLCCAPLVSARAQTAQPVEGPQWLKLNLTHSSLDLEMEGESETRNTQGSSGDVSRDRLYLAPTID